MVKTSNIHVWCEGAGRKCNLLFETGSLAKAVAVISPVKAPACWLFNDKKLRFYIWAL